MEFITVDVIYEITNFEDNVPIFNSRRFILASNLIQCARSALPYECWNAISNKTGSKGEWNPIEDFTERFKDCFDNSITKIELKTKLDFGYIDKETNSYIKYTTNIIYVKVPFDKLFEN